MTDGWRLIACVAVLASCGHAQPSVDIARQALTELPHAMSFASTHEDRALAAALEGGARNRPAAALASGIVHRAGDRLVDGSGNPLALRGVNLGGAFLWEAWIWGGDLSLLHMGDQSETHIRAALARLVGDDAVAAFAHAVYDAMAADADFAAMADHGFDVVRVPLNHRMLADPEGLAALDRVLARAEAHGIYVVLDLHAAPGGQSKYFIADPERDRLWSSEPAQARTVALWRTLAERYRGRAVIAGYDLLNEPDPPSGRALVELYTRIVRAIREVDPDHVIVLEGADFARDFSMFSATLDPNQIFSFHLYTWFGNDAAKRIARYAEVAKRLGAPMWCGEFGENGPAAVAEQVGLFDHTPQVAGWAFWTWKKAKNRYPALHEIITTPAWRATVEWLADP